MSVLQFDTTYISITSLTKMLLNNNNTTKTFCNTYYATSHWFSVDCHHHRHHIQIIVQ